MRCSSRSPTRSRVERVGQRQWNRHRERARARGAHVSARACVGGRSWQRRRCDRYGGDPAATRGGLRMIRALVVDDEPLSRRAVVQLLTRHADVVVAGECADGAAAMAALETGDIDVVFLDVRMPEMTGLDVARSRDGRERPLVVFVAAYETTRCPLRDRRGGLRHETGRRGPFRRRTRSCPAAVESDVGRER